MTSDGITPLAPKRDKNEVLCWPKLLFAAALLATVVAAFYTIENWRGRRAWQQVREELTAKGFPVKFEAFAPPPLPDASNFLKAGPLEDWFRKDPRETNTLSQMPRLPPGLTSIPPTMEELQSWPAMLRVVQHGSPLRVTDKSVAPAVVLLKWLEQYRESFALLYAASERPGARFDFDYSRGIETEIPHFVRVRTVAQVLTTHAKASLVAGRPEDAVRDLNVLRSLVQSMESSPTLVGAMIGVAIGGLYIDVVQCGLRSHSWREPDLVAIEAGLGSFRFLSDVEVAMRGGELANVITLLGEASRSRLLDIDYGRSGMEKVENWLYIRLAPRGWIYQNMVTYAHIVVGGLELLDPDAGRVFPAKEPAVMRLFDEAEGFGPYRFMARSCIPNLLKAFQRSAQSQSIARMGQVACALERYRLVHGRYPKDLSPLTPDLISVIPCDVTTGDPLIYRVEGSGRYALYSRGWDMADGGGGKDDWVWNSPKE